MSKNNKYNELATSRNDFDTLASSQPQAASLGKNTDVFDSEEGLNQTYKNNNIEIETKRLFGLSINQIIAVCIILFSIFFFVYYQYELKCEQKYQSEFVEENMCWPLKKYLKYNRYDIHHFIQDAHNKAGPKIVLLAKDNSDLNQNKKRELITLTKSDDQYEKMIYDMIHPSCRVYRERTDTARLSIPNPITKKDYDLAFFFSQLEQYPQKQQHKQVQFYRYHKLYNIGDYEKQLPICSVLVGKNNFKVIDKMYTSIQRQNYTNFKIVHIDDNSNDGTVDKILNYLQTKPKLLGKVTLVTQPYQKQALYNRNFAIRKFCGQNDIVFDMDADDWLIGSQVFQLVNTIYQTGHIYKENKQDVWAAYFSFIERPKKCQPFPRLVGGLPQQVLENHLYRTYNLWRTSHLRTFLKAVHDKMDEEDYIDKILMNNEFYLEQGDSFTHRSIVQLTAPKHLMFIDQFVYFYLASPTPSVLTEFDYAFLESQALRPYLQLQSLDAPAKRLTHSLLNQQRQKQLTKMRQQIRQKRKKMIQKVTKMYYG